MQKVNGGEELMWPMLDKGAHLIASLAVKRDITQETALDNKEKGEQERKLISSTSTQKKIRHTKEVKRKAAEWPWSKLKWTQCPSTKDKSLSKNWLERKERIFIRPN
jgi:hypothetical protein